MSMNVRGPLGNGVVHAHMAFQTLMHTSSLGYIHWNPIPILSLLRIDEVARQWLERSVNGIDLILILLSRLSGPTNVRRRNAYSGLTVTE